MADEVEIMSNVTNCMGHDYESIPVFRPTLPAFTDFLRTINDPYSSGIVTLGTLVDLFEDDAQRFTRAQHAVAISTCTSGLMLVFTAMAFTPGAEVIVPSFTFPATVQALFWNNLTPVFVDCLPGTMALDPDEAVKAIGPKTAAIFPVNIFGLPPDVDELETIAGKFGLPLIFDSAQGMGSTYRGRRVGGFGSCEVFSLSPTKVITAIEGGLVTTNDRELADKLTSMRDYGKGAEDDGMVFNGLSARMSEFHAAVGLLSLRKAEELISARLNLVGRYRRLTAHFPGCRVQEFPDDRTSSGNYFTLLIGKKARTGRDAVYKTLKDHNIQSKKYFFPPVHVQPAFRNRPHRIVGELINTWNATRCSLALPLFAHMTYDQQDRVCSILESLLG